MANASPPKVQNKLRKRASTLSPTATTFMAPGSQNPSVATMGPIVRVSDHTDQDYRQLHEAATKEAKVWEEKHSSSQNQIHYERERWEEKYGELERMYRGLENSRTEANADKMNLLLDTVQQLQLANEVFRKQLQDAGLDPDPMPAAEFPSRHLLVGENLDRTFLEENELMKEKLLITNQKIAHLSSEIDNVAIAISQTVNYAQLRYLTQMLDAAEHVSSQRRTRAMSNSFLSDKLSRGVKKTGPAHAKNTNTIATQTSAMVLSEMQQQGLNGSSTFRPLESTLSKSFSFTSSLLNLAGLNSNGQGSAEVMYKLKGGVTDDRSQLSRQGIHPQVVQDLKGSPASPDSVDIAAANRVNPPLPKFQYTYPTSSQLQIFVPDTNNLSAFGQSPNVSNMSIASGSRANSVLKGLEHHHHQFRRSTSDISLQMAGLQNQLQQQQQNHQGPVRTGGKYPYPYPSSSSSSSNLSSRTPSQRTMSFTTAPNNLPRAMSQQFLSPEMPTFLGVKDTFNCGACVAGVVTVKNIAWFKKSWALDGVHSLCPYTTSIDADACTNFIYTEGSILVDSLLTANIMGGDGKLICYHVRGICAAPAVTSGTLTFPKGRPTNSLILTPSSNFVDVLHLSDWHVDNKYVAGSKAVCKKALCRRKYSDSPTNVTRAAPSPEKITPQLKAAFDAMAVIKAKVYPTIGIHEASPLNIFPTSKSGGDISWFYNILADDWTRWLTSDAVTSFKHYGSYTLTPVPGFRTISFNTNFCYTLNFYLYGHTDEYDPHDEQLQKSEDAGECVWIVGHLPPSQVDCINNWSSLYRQVIQRYSPHVIAEQFFGHSHYDESSLTYGPGSKSAKNAVSTAWIGPSVTPYTDLNPAFGVYKVDTKTWNVFDSLTYVADLDKSASWNATSSSPNWHLEYSARQTYGASAPIAADAPLSAGWWHNVPKAFETNYVAFKQFYSFRGHGANRLPECTQANGCVSDIICDLRASMRSEICSSVLVPMKKRDDGDEDAAADV
ncbi:hypothetical protein BGX29_000830 [Mortierella sp. GBA35]|nr:hypothetical protein BGX29_000830 [Mortierella sp. GBA35]